MKFYQKYKAGLLKAEDIHDYIDLWHDCDEPEEPISEFLGMTREQYFKWALTGEL